MRYKNRHSQVCSLCLEYISGGCSDKEKLAFERHLPACADCQSEMDELRMVWEEIPSAMEQFEPPADLKKQVMDAVKAGDTKSKTIQSAVKRSHGRGWRQTRGIIVAAGLLLFILGSAWNVQLYRERMASPIIPLEQALSVSPAQIERFIPLRPHSAEMPNSYAVACIVDNGYNKQFVVYVFGAETTQGASVYQVWLGDGKGQQSAGTFRVGDKGIGVLAMPIIADSLTFDSIFITLEPDERSEQPRGMEIYDSKLS